MWCYGVHLIDSNIERHLIPGQTRTAGRSGIIMYMYLVLDIDGLQAWLSE